MALATHAAKTPISRKTSNVTLRMNPDQKTLLEEAARISGRTITDIVTEGARERALAILREEQELQTWRLSRADATAFVTALTAEPKVTSEGIEQYRAYLESRATRFVRDDVTG
jgi:uncharacterized protein (DUF1778 family)